MTIKQIISLVNNRLQELLLNYKGRIDYTLYKCMDYALFPGGKRIRPLLMLLLAEHYGFNIDALLDFACTLEIIHSYSLVHDDLPELDNDEIRRGQQTVHRKFGHAMGLLTGDALLNFSYEIITNISQQGQSNAKAAHYLSTKAGVLGMINGQVLDIIHNTKQLDLETLKQIYKGKTCALFQSSTVIPFILNNYTQDIILQFEKLGFLIGMCFQIKDDIIDYESGHDSAEKMCNLVNITSKQASKELLIIYQNQILDMINTLSLDKSMFFSYINEMILS